MKAWNVLLVVILCLGALQGIIYGIILWKNKGPNAIANRFLAIFLFFFAYRLIVETLKSFGIGYYDTWYHFLLEYNWIYGALVYFFAKSYVTPNFKFSRKEWIHFLPVVFEFIFSNFIKSQNFFWDGTRESLTWLGYYGYIVWMHYPTIYIICGILIVYYAWRSLHIVRQAKTHKLVKPERVVWIKRVLHFLRYYSIGFMSIVLIDLIFFDYAFDAFYYYPLFTGMAIITYWLGMEGYARRNDIVQTGQSKLSSKESEQLDAIAQQLEYLMQHEKPFKNPDLSLASLSAQLEIKPYLLTRCLNIRFEKKFSDYINEYRIEEVKTMLQDPRNSDYTLLGIAFDAGFNSKASFNRAAKKITGKSPNALKFSE